ncbi:MAG: phosphate ABC transporter substrate-binding protein PstS [Bacillota bacterium]|nr:phosphate ABC transporter substrate-binding protein PstS [Bacillota bacterium]
MSGLRRASSRARVLSIPVVALALSLVLGACGGGAATPPSSTSQNQNQNQNQGGASSGGSSSSEPVTITGAGSTFDNPLFTKMFTEYHNLHPNVQVNYQAVGSGAGQQQLFQHLVDFGASDAPLNDQQMQDHPSIVHIPITLGAVAIGYNLPNIGSGLHLTGDVLAKIYLGQIKKWNDPAIQSLNPDTKLPNLPIAVVHRSDGSGTTFIFTSYLSAVSPDWKSKVGNGTSVNWPTGVGAKGSDGVSAQVKQVSGGIGYFEMAYAMQNNIPMATLKNKDGQWVEPSVDGASVGANQAADNMPSDLRAMFVDAPGPTTYPIAGFSWLLIDKDRVSTPLLDLVDWMIHDGQSYAKDLYYGPLPDKVVQMDEQKIQELRAAAK